MKSVPSAIAALAIAVALSSSFHPAQAATPRSTAAVGPATPAERGAMARAYVLKWGGYVQRVYRVPVRVWADRMVPTFAHADADNFRKALRRDTYEGASAMLAGVGSRLSDAQVIDSMARASLAPPSVRPELLAKTLGAATSDLVYTPVTPCRILDTRVAGGALTGGASRDFNAVVGSGGNFSSQGGSATDCGMVAAGQSAVAINLTAVTPTGAGYATAYPFGVTRPLASTVNYVAGDIVANSIVVKLPSPLTTKDFTIFTYATADYVADIVGYYAPPKATALQCTQVNGTSHSSPANGYDLTGFAASCPSGYEITAMGLHAGSNIVIADSNMFSGGGSFFVYNLGNSAQTVTAYAQCCRVPGR